MGFQYIRHLKSGVVQYLGIDWSQTPARLIRSSRQKVESNQLIYHILTCFPECGPLFFELTHTNAVADSLMRINSETQDMDVFTSISFAKLLRYNRKKSLEK